MPTGKKAEDLTAEGWAEMNFGWKSLLPDTRSGSQGALTANSRKERKITVPEGGCLFSTTARRPGCIDRSVTIPRVVAAPWLQAGGVVARRRAAQWGWRSAQESESRNLLTHRWRPCLL